MMTPGNKPQNQGVEMFDEYSFYGNFSAANGGAQLFDAAPLLDGFCFQNAANCPDCEGGMVKQGGCFSCPSCGFSACA